VTAYCGVPAGESEELEGLRYQAAQTRKDLGGTVHALTEKVVHHPSAGELAWWLTGAAARRTGGAARRAVRGQLGRPGRSGARTRHNRWAPAAAVAGGGLMAGLLAVSTVRHRQQAR
jgi:hypothetical protein